MSASPPEAVWIVDALTLRIVAVNDAALAISGFARDQLVGHAVTSLAATPEDLAFWADAHAGRDDRLLSESLLKRADGSALPVTRRIRAIEMDGRRVFMVTMNARGVALRGD